jgi:hypothetical protein
VEGDALGALSLSCADAQAEASTASAPPAIKLRSFMVDSIVDDAGQLTRALTRFLPGHCSGRIREEIAVFRRVAFGYAAG